MLSNKKHSGLIFWLQLQFISEAFCQIFLALSSWISVKEKLVYFERNFAGKLAWIFCSCASISRLSVMYVLFLKEFFLVSTNTFAISLFVVITAGYLLQLLPSKSNLITTAYHLFPSVLIEMFAFYIMFQKGENASFYWAALSQLAYLSLFVFASIVPAWILEILNVFIWIALYSSVQSI